MMLAFDHGYIMGSTAGLERIDVTIAPLCQYTDVLMGTGGHPGLHPAHRPQRRLPAGPPMTPACSSTT